MSILPRIVLPGAACLLVLLAAGCGGGSGVGKTYPVAGKVTLNGQPVVSKSAVIQFKPDAAKGNTSPFEPAGGVDDGGNYTLTTNGQRGAPAGWYKVIVTAVEAPAPPAGKKPLTHRPEPKSLIPSKYAQEKFTIGVEVVERPAAGAYDLTLTD